MSDSERITCPNCRTMMVLSTLETWTPSGGWRDEARATCHRIRNGKACGTVVVLDAVAIPDRPAPAVVGARS
ncbi:MAG TPA: hypothetical protein VGO93_28675 [Candidatus Xenobia bacterium]|jgi:hypothetical protein